MRKIKRIKGSEDDTGREETEKEDFKVSKLFESISFLN